MPYYGNLRGHKEYVFRQSILGSEAHIAVDATEWEQAWVDGDFANLRIDTWCGKNLKYGTNSMISIRTAGVRNACEYCFVEYAPEDDQVQDDYFRHSKEISHSDLPFLCKH